MRPFARTGGSLAFFALLLLILAACAPAAPASPTPIPKATAVPAASTPAAQPTSAPATPTAAPKPTVAPTSPPAAAKPTGAPVKIGFLTPLSGPMAPNGATQRYGPIIAVEDINASGGINGAPFEMISYDSPFNPQQAVSMVRKLAGEDKVFAIVGPYATSEAQVAFPLGNELQIPVVNATSTLPGLAAANRPWAFQYDLTDDVLIPVAIQAYKQKYPNVKKMVITGDTKSAVNEPIVNQLFGKLLTAQGYEVLGTVAFTTGMTDLSAVVTKIKDLKPEGLAVSALTPEGLLLAKEMVRQGVKVPVVITAHVFAGAAFAIQGKEAVEGWITPGWVDAEAPNPRMQKFVARYKQLGEADPLVPKPIFIAAETVGYDAVSSIAEVMRQKKITATTPLQEARTAIRDGLQNLKDFPGLSGNVTVSPAGDVRWAGAPAFMAQNGWWVKVK